MKKILNKNFYFIVSITFILLFLIHLPLMTKNIITADVLLNNNYYNGYSWELSLGRFGLYIVGILKSYISIPHIELVISYLIISIITYLLIDLFNVENKLNKGLIIGLMVLSPIISSTLLFSYCSVPYLLSFLAGVLSIYIYNKLDNKYLRVIIPILLMIFALSMYQAYLSLIVTVFIIHELKLIFDHKLNIKKSINYIIMILISIISYFILMKLSQLVFSIDMSTYSNANKIGIDLITSIPHKIIDSYKLTYQFMFTDTFMKNNYLHNNLLNLLLIIIFIITIITKIIKSNLSIKEIILVGIIILLLPIFLNSVIFVISDTKLQLLMATSYLILPIYLFSIIDTKYLKIATLVITILLFRNYTIQVNATYKTLENTFNTYKTVINSAVNKYINEPEKHYVLIGKYNNNSLKNNISKLNYGYISDENLFWDEYNLRKIGFERFTNDYLGLDLEYVTEEEKELIKNEKNDIFIYSIDNIVVINFNNYKEKNYSNE